MSGSTEQGIEVRGTLRADDGVGVVRIEAVVDVAIAVVWSAVTEPEGLAGWAGEVRGDLRVGGDYSAVLFPSGWDGTGRVLECGPGHRFLVESAEPGAALKTDELVLTAEPSGGTRVVLTKRGVPLPMIAAYGVGTQIHMENLIGSLAGRGPIDPEPYWAALLPRYEQLGAGI
jgi:uncharacterized protein YndB with AHSA1/START domain